VGLDREQLEASIDAVLLGVRRERLGVGEPRVARRRLDEHRRQAAEVRAQ
jgi:hypothetical protein